MEYYSAVKKKEPVDTDNNPGKSPENYVEWEKKKKQSSKVAYCMVPFMYHS